MQKLVHKVVEKVVVFSRSTMFTFSLPTKLPINLFSTIIHLYLLFLLFFIFDNFQANVLCIRYTLSAHIELNLRQAEPSRIWLRWVMRQRTDRS